MANELPSSFVPDKPASFVPDSPSDKPPSFVPDKPASFVPDQPGGGTLLGKTWSGLKYIGKAIVKDIFETGARIGTDQIAKTVLPGNTLYVNDKHKEAIDMLPVSDQYKEYAKVITNPKKLIPEKVDLPVLGETSIRYSDNPVKRAGQGINDAINVLSLFNPLVGLLGKSGGIVGKETVAQATKTFAKQQLVKRGIDFTAGAGFGLAADLQDGVRDPAQIAKDMVIAGAVNTVATPVVGGLFKGLFKVTGGGVKFIDGALEKLSSELKDFSKPVAKQIGRGQALMEMANPETFLRQTIGQQGAEKLSAAIDWTRNLPQKMVTKLLDDMNPVRQVVGLIKRLTGIEVDPGDDAYKLSQVSDSQGFYNAEQRIKKYAKIKSQYPEMNEQANSFLLGLDLLERAKHGPLPNGKTAADIQRDLGDLVSQMNEEEITKLREIQSGVRGYLEEQLQSAVDAGFLTPESYAKIKASHPNYIPHNIVDYITPDGSFEIGGGYSVANGPIKRAVGSERAIEGVDQAILRNTVVSEILATRNRIGPALIKQAEKLGEDGMADAGFIGLRTAEKVTKRNALLTQAKELKDNIAILEATKSQALSGSKELKGKIAQTSKKIDSLYKDLQQTINDLGDKESADILFKVEPAAKTIDDLAVSFQTKANLEKEFGSVRNMLNRSVKENREVESLLRVAGFSENSIKAILNGLEAKQVPRKPSELSKFLVDFQSAPTQRLPKMLKINGQEVDFATMIEDKQFLDNLTETLGMQADNMVARKKEMVKQIRDLSDINIKSIDRPNQEKISFYRNGVREDWLVPKDVGEALKNMDVEQIPWFLDGIASLNKMFKDLTTTYSLPFIVRNATRDPQNAAVVAKYGLLPQDWARAMADIVGAKQGNGSKYYEEWRRLGGPLSSIFDDNLSPTEMYKKLDRTINGMQKSGNANLPMSIGEKVIQGPANVFKNIKAINELTEETTRLAVFIRALESGAHPLDAVLESKNATVNFSRMGSMIRTANKVVPFLNARLQGGANTVKAFIDNPETFIRRTFSSAVIPAMWLYGHNNKEEYQEAYNNIPPATRDMFWIFMVGSVDGVDGSGNNYKVPLYVKMPKGEPQQVISMVWDQIMDIHKKNDPESWGEFTKSLAGTATPIQYSGFGPISAIPELYSNYDQFLDKPIEPDYIRGKRRNDLHSYERYNDNTSSFAKKMAGSKDSPIARLGINISPIQLDHILNKVFSSVGRDINNVYTLKEDGVKFKTEKPSDWEVLSRVPVINSFISDSSFPQNPKLQELQEKTTRERSSRDLRIMDELEPFIEKSDISGLRNALIQNEDFNDMNPFEQQKAAKSILNKFIKQIVDKDKTIMSRYDGETLYYYNADKIDKWATSHDTASLVGLLKELNAQGVPDAVLTDLAQRALADYGYLNRKEEPQDGEEQPTE